MAASQYVTRCTLSVNGQFVTDDFKAFVEKARIPRKEVKLMYRTSMARLTERYQIELDYVLPSDTEPYDFASVENGTLVVTFDSGKQITYGQVSALEVGDRTIDGETEAVQKITLLAGTRNLSTGETVSPAFAS